MVSVQFCDITHSLGSLEAYFVELSELGLVFTLSVAYIGDFLVLYARLWDPMEAPLEILSYSN